MMVKRANFIFAALLGASLIGCSGSGNGNSGDPYVKMLNVGDMWVLNGTRMVGNDSHTYSDSVEMVQTDLNGTPHLMIQHTTSVDGVQAAVYGPIITQGENSRDLTQIGRVKTDGTVEALPAELLLPGRLHVGTRWTMLRGDGELDNVNYEVTAAEQIVTAAGTFDTYKVHSESPGPNGSTDTSDRWFSTDLGAYVKTVETRTNNSGTVIVTSAELASTNVSG
jgi:hypothetical protein